MLDSLANEHNSSLLACAEQQKSYYAANCNSHLLGSAQFLSGFGERGALDKTKRWKQVDSKIDSGVLGR
jgi:hypothetical protein